MENYFSPFLDEKAMHNISTLGLAHIGDSVFELLSRCHLATNGIATSKNLHRQTIAIVNANAQAKSARAIVDLLTEDEHAVFNRGRNSKPKTIPKSTTREEYGLATALEALFGYLYLTQKYQRINELFDIIINQK